MLPSNKHGEIPGISYGDHFSSRFEAAVAGVHRKPMNGIDAPKERGQPAYAVSLSGKYNDEDKGDTVWYEGEGRKGDQSYEKKSNMALRSNHDKAVPVRVLRQLNGRSYVFDGLYTVTSHNKFFDSEEERYKVMFELTRIKTQSREPKFKVTPWRNSKLSKAGSRKDRKRWPWGKQLFFDHEKLHELVRWETQPLVSDISGGKELMPIPVFDETGEGATKPIAPENFEYIRTSSLTVASKAAKELMMYFDNGSSAMCSKAIHAEKIFNEDGLLCEGNDGGIVEDENAHPYVSLGARVPLEIFFTGHHKGWGVRSPIRILSGAFVCEYVGEYRCNGERNSSSCASLASLCVLSAVLEVRFGRNPIECEAAGTLLISTISKGPTMRRSDESMKRSWT